MRSLLSPVRRASVVAGAALVAAGCGSSSPGDDEADGTAATTEQGSASSSTSASVSDGALDLSVSELPSSLEPLSGAFSKYVDVWGVNLVATAATDDSDLLHAANVMAQYLDNDADGSPDDPEVVASMVANNATLVMGATPDEFENIDADEVFDFVGAAGQDLYGSETNPVGGFDASLEEVHHLILNTGWAQVYPDQLAQAKDSGIAAAMDVARGGQYDTIPEAYPDEAWYTYDDETCDYTCMITEYAYWAHTSLLGAQQGRADEIGNEWKLETPGKVRATDTAATQLLEDPALGLPTALPDGNYTG